MSTAKTDPEVDMVPTKDAFTNVPSGRQQREKIESLQEEEESSHVYCLAKAWYAQWQTFVQADPKASKSPTPPGPLNMDLKDEEKNTYIDEKIWRCWVEWYGVAETHQLDRRNWASDEKEFEICVLSPYSGIVANPTKAFDISEETGYVELQLRKMFRVAACRNTRLWACEKARNARFHLLLDRTQEICYQSIDRERPYILALEIANADGSWPTHMPGEPHGSLSQYAALTGTGSGGGAFWEQELATTIDAVFAGITAELRETVSGVVSTSKCISQQKEQEAEAARDRFEGRIQQLSSMERAVERRAREVAREEDATRTERKRLAKERAGVERDRQQLKEEMAAMEALNRIADAKVKLNIGGHLYMTSTSTLVKESGSMLAAMFSGRHSLKRQDDDGSFFIDRDGTHFRYVLNYLRDGGFKEGTLSSDDVSFLNELLTEAEFYGLSGLVQLLQGHLGRHREEEEPGIQRSTPSRVSKRKISLLKEAKR